MTAPDAVPDGTTVEQLAAALRAYHDVQPSRAAVELLIGHNAGSAHWLRSDQFRACVEWMPAEDEDDEAMARVDWAAADELIEEAEVAVSLVATDSEVAVLAVACSIAIGAITDAATTCDVHNRRLIAAAVVAALGLSWGDVMTAAQS